jgi:hypothetical protein
MTIQQTIDIPASHRLMLDLPQEVPEGKAKIKVFIKPFSKRAKARTLQEAPAGDERDLSEGVPLGNGLIFFEAPPGYTPPPPDPELAAIMKEAREKTERRRTDPAYRAEVTKIWKELQEGGPVFDGRDGMDVQREMRDEWPD